MKKNVITLIVLSIFVAPVLADKPEWAGKGKPTEEQKAAHNAAMKAKEDGSEDTIKEMNNKKDKETKKDKELKAHQKQKEKQLGQAQKDLDEGIIKNKKDMPTEAKGLEKQSDKKSEQQQKELDKGSDKGQEKKQEKSKKWWKFWGE